jgi:deazaflavin-dependent oxidoreductase (nitroreductase family)
MDKSAACARSRSRSRTVKRDEAVSYRYADANAIQRMARRTAGWRPVSWLYARALHHIDRATYRLTGGRAMFSSVVSGLPVVLLTTRGARTGVERTLPLLGIPDGDAVIVVGSNYGQRRDPAWAFNLRANPAVRARIDGRERELVARELTGAERDAAYERDCEVYPARMAYRRRAAPRVIPLFRLEPRE